MTDIKIVGTMTDAFISEIICNGETFSAYYEEHNNALILHRYHDFVTRFVVFYENDEKLHPQCIRTLLRPGMEILELSDMSLEPLFRKAMEEYRLRDRIRGCLIGGAAGDALGYPVEFFNEKEIEIVYGADGITGYLKQKKSGKALISDDTQMTLFTANGILFRETRGEMRGVAAGPAEYIAKSYQDWLWTQEHSFGKRPEYSVSWLLDIPELYKRRAPGNTCLSALRYRKTQNSSPECYYKESVIINDSKGCGGIMRVAPLGLVERGGINALKDSAEAASITHGHSMGYIPAAVLGDLIHRIVFLNKPLDAAVQESVLAVQKVFGDDEHFDELVCLLDRAVDLSENTLPDSENIHALGGGWTAEENLAIAIYCSLKHRDNFSKAIIAAVNHRGDSDSTGSVTGNIMGALLGYEAIDAKWKTDLELSDVIIEIADDLYHGCVVEGYSCGEEWERKYIDCKRKRS